MCEIKQDGPARQGHADGHRIGRKTPLNTAEGGHQDGPRDIDEVNGNQPLFHRLFGIGANATNMPSIAQCCDANAIFHGALNAECHGLRRHGLAKTPFAINHGKGAAIGHHIGGLAFQHIARFQPFHIARHAHHAVAVMPGKIRIHQMAADALAFRAIAAGGLKHISDERIKRLGIDHDGGCAAHEGVLRK